MQEPYRLPMGCFVALASLALGAFAGAVIGRLIADVDPFSQWGVTASTWEDRLLAEASRPANLVQNC